MTRFFDQRIGRTAIIRLAALSAALIFPSLAEAQAYPSRPIRLVIAVAPGGGTDIISRLLATRLTERLAKTVVVDNRGGGNFIIGTSIVAKAAPDGYTLVTAANASHAINPGLFRDLYVALGEPLEDGQSWAVRVYHKPFIRWLWLGAIFMGAGAALSATDKRYRIRKTDEAPALAGEKV